jgi:predicted O-methyltransferase YrrM
VIAATPNRLPPFELGDPAGGVAARLHELSERQERSPSLRWFAVRRWLRSRVGLGSPDWSDPALRRFLGDKLVALDRDKCRLCYLLCRSSHATRIVEIGTSFGVSTIYLAAAARDNAEGRTSEGLVIATEIDPVKAAAARANLEQAGLERFAEVREGDFRESLRGLAGPVDFVLLDIWAPLAGPAIELLAPHLRLGGIVACDNVQRLRREYRDYLGYIEDPANGFYCLTLPMRGGFGLAVRQ